MTKYNKKYYNKQFSQKLTTTAKLRLREQAGFDKTILTIIPKGETVKVLSKTTDDWYKVSYNGQQGFCNKNWLQ